VVQPNIQALRQKPVKKQEFESLNIGSELMRESKTDGAAGGDRTFGGQSQLSLLKSFNLPQNGVNRCSPALNKFAYNLIVI